MLEESVRKANDNANDAKGSYSEELHELEQMLLQFRESSKTGTDMYIVLMRWQHEIPRLHAFVRGMLYGL